VTGNSWLQIALYFGVLLAVAEPLGAYMARVYSGERVLLERVLGPVERGIYRLAGVRVDDEMRWPRYAGALLVFSVLSTLVAYAFQRVQGALPANPAHLGAVAPDLAFNTAVSFATNTNWQFYGGETTLSYLTQAVALGVQNFVSAAAGMTVLVALVRGFRRVTSTTIGNFWVDLTRGTLYILLPLSLILALALVSQGVVQTWRAAPVARLIEPQHLADTVAATTQTIAVGPAAGQVAIKQLGTNGGGFFNVNSAHPFENPTPLSNFLEVLAILLIPAALCHTFGRMVRDRRQGWAVLAAMTIVLAPLVVYATRVEQRGTPVLAAAGADQAPSALQAGGNMEGKEVRFGIANSALWASATTAASNGSVNAMHDSFTPLGGLIPMWLIQLGEVIYGGVGSGLYGMLVFALIAVFIAGLMVGRTPEYLGKKIEAYEMKMAALVILVPAAAVLVGTALAVSLPAGRATIFNPGPHGFSEALYTFSSTSNNNGSAFGGLGPNVFYNVATAVAMWLGRYWVAVPVLAIAGSLAGKKSVPVGAGTLPTHTPLFVALLVGTVLLVGALTFLPALALGPIVEHLQLWGAR
jgi:K+-transporting ATPase ATPase A chain